MFEKTERKDIIQIFSDSLFLYKKEPVYVEAITGDNDLLVRNLNEKKDFIVKVGEIELTPVPLGMCNQGRNAYYVSRNPIRQYKQGLSHDSISVSSPCKNKSSTEIETIKRILNSNIRECILNIYPSIDESLELLDADKRDSVAFCRIFSIDKRLNLYYKTEKVGMIDIDNKKFIFNRDKLYLNRILNAKP